MNNEERRKTLIEFILRNQGCTKADIEKSNIPISRKTIFKLIDELKEDGLVEERWEKPNSREHKLFVMENNLTVRVTFELEEFEKPYRGLLKRLKERSNKIDFSAIAAELNIKEMDPKLWSATEFERYLEYDDKVVSEVERISKLKTKLGHEFRRKSQSNIVDRNTENEITSFRNEVKLVLKKLENSGNFFSSMGPILIFKILIYAYSCRGTLIWPQIIKDKQTLSKLYTIVYTKIAEIQLHLTEFLRSFDKVFGGIEDAMTEVAIKQYFSSIDMKDFLSVWFTYCELIHAHKEIQDIVESLIWITKEIEEHGDYNSGLSEGLDECSSLPTLMSIMWRE
jgi:winged-helix domain-containing protein